MEFHETALRGANAAVSEHSPEVSQHLFDQRVDFPELGASVPDLIPQQLMNIHDLPNKELEHAGQLAW